MSLPPQQRCPVITGIGLSMYATAPIDTLPPHAQDLSASLLALTTALDERDPYTDRHCDRVYQLTAQLGQRLHMPAQDLQHLAVAARFHDIGKLGIPDAVLHKPGRLDAQEMELMRSHPLRGERVFLATGRGDAAPVARLIRQHHEAWDGSGYPDGLCGEQIELGARILSLVDGYDAMITDRPYRAGMPHAQVMRTLAAEVGTRLDPQVHAHFLQMMQTAASPA